MERRPIRYWEMELHKCKEKLENKLRHQNPTTLLGILMNWHPEDIVDDKNPRQPKRARGRLLTAWNQFVD